MHGARVRPWPSHRRLALGSMQGAFLLPQPSGTRTGVDVCCNSTHVPPCAVYVRREGDGPQMNCRALAFAGEEHACFNEAAHRLLRSLLAPDPRDRPSASQALQHDWFKSFDLIFVPMASSASPSRSLERNGSRSTA